jgi:2-dehydro-3-deoxygalactonokinase
LAGTAEWVAVDWGTSNVRAWGIDATGATVFAEESDKGMGKISPPDYPAVLSGLLQPHGATPGEVLICGMAGARQGWKEAVYLDTPADLSRLIDGSVVPEGAPYPTRILPGVCQRTGSEDVMRGEETQILGLTALKPEYSGVVIMPGTHSKWVQLADGRITGFASAMTGEIYEILSTHSVLRHSFNGERNGPATEDGVSAGLEAGLSHPEQLTSLLFRTRAAALLSGRAADWCSGYLSGVLIGAEVGARRDVLAAATAPVPLVGSTRLSQVYATALARFGVQSEAIDATDATIAGLKAARAQGQKR